MALLPRSRSTMLPPTSFHRPTPMDPLVAGGTTQRSRRPDWVLLQKLARISAHRNTTTAGCQTMENEAIEVSFWLVDPPGVSYFSVHCPGLGNKEFDEEPYILCAEAALVLFEVSFLPVPYSGRISKQYFVYRAGPGNPSLHLIPDPDRITRSNLYGLLPCGDTGHYALVFLDKQFIVADMAWRFDVHAYSSRTESWSSKVPLSGLSEDDHKLLLRHGTSKQIIVGGTSLGWVDLFDGILLLCDVFGDSPVVKYISLPASRVCQMDEDGHPYFAPAFCCDVSCCDDVIKFVEIKFDDPRHRIAGNQSWKAITWDRRMTMDDWRPCFTVDVANISVDPSYSCLLAGLRNDKTQQLELKKLILYTLMLSKHDDSLLYAMCKASNEDDKAWVITVDMENAAVKAMAPYSTRGRRLVSLPCPCTFPKYLDLNPGDDLTMHSKRISVADLVRQVRLTRDWFLDLDARLEIGRPTYDDCIALLHSSPVSSLLLDIQEVVKYAFNAGRGGAALKAGRGGAALKAADFCSRALEDFDMLLRESLCHPSSSTEAMRSKTSVALQGLDSILNIVVPSVRVIVDACQQKRDEAIFELGEKPGQREDHNLQDYPDANLSHRTSNDSRGNKKKRSRGRKDKRDEQAVGPGRPLEQSRSPSCLLIFVCLVSAPIILTPIVMKCLGYHLSM